MNSANFDSARGADHSSQPIGESSSMPSITLAHFSDPHFACLQDITVRDLLTKRLFGCLRWKLHRGSKHGDIVLSALQSDLKQTKPDHIAVTGDLTHLSLSVEFKKSRRWLQSLGSPSKVTVVPGNHDRYIDAAWGETLAHWSDYMLSDTPRDADDNPENLDRMFPSLRIREPIAIIGVCTARPTAPHLALGSIGARQLQNLDNVLTQTARQEYYRVLLIHHSPVPGAATRRKGLTDATDLQAILKRHGTELILHGHDHRDRQGSLKLAAGSIPVMGAPSISALDHAPERRARYYLYRISPNGGQWKVNLEVRIFHPGKNRFVTERTEESIRAPNWHR